MTASSIIADKLVLLFSTDWFRPYWALTGFVPRADEAEDFQRSMREVVTSMMQDADDYWLVSFAETRLNETRDAFLSALDRYRAEASDLSLIYALVEGRDSLAAVTDVSMKFWDNYEATLKDIRRAPIAETDWDRGVVAFTADLPNLSRDFAITLLRADF